MFLSIFGVIWAFVFVVSHNNVFVIYREYAVSFVQFHRVQVRKLYYSRLLLIIGRQCGIVFLAESPNRRESYLGQNTALYRIWD